MSSTTNSDNVLPAGERSPAGKTKGGRPGSRAPGRFALGGRGGTILIVMACLVLYELTTDVFGLLDGMLFPGLGKIVSALRASMPRLIESFFSSMRLLIPGYLIGALSGIILGIVVGLHPRLNKAVKPIIFALSPVPPSMLTPYLIAIMPTFYSSSVGIIFLGVFWPFLSSTINGIVLIDQKYLDNAKILELRGARKLFYVVLPAAAPHILSGAGTGQAFLPGVLQRRGHAVRGGLYSQPQLHA